MFRRKAYNRLLAWKQNGGGTAMLIEGARRVGKSTVAEESARNEYDSYALVDFTRMDAEFRQTLLDMRNDLDGLFLYLCAALGVTLTPHRSLVIFDEVQMFPQAREFIKHLVADGRFDYIETGSLISINANARDILIPSEEESMRMGPMDFEEFLWAMGEEALARMIRHAFESGVSLPDSLHRKASRLWHEYMLVGGMPQSVAAYAPPGTWPRRTAPSAWCSNCIGRTSVNTAVWRQSACARYSMQSRASWRSMRRNWSIAKSKRVPLP